MMQRGRMMKDYTEELKKLLKAKYEDVAVLEFDKPSSVKGDNKGRVVAIIDSGNGHEFRIDEYTPDFIVTLLGSILGKITHKLVPVEAQQ